VSLLAKDEAVKKRGDAMATEKEFVSVETPSEQNGAAGILGCAMRGTWWGSSSAFVSQFLRTLALPVINACSKLHTAERERKLANSRFTKKPPQQVH